MGNTGFIIDIDLDKKYEKKRKKYWLSEREMCLLFKLVWPYSEKKKKATTTGRQVGWVSYTDKKKC